MVAAMMNTSPKWTGSMLYWVMSGRKIGVSMMMSTEPSMKVPARRTNSVMMTITTLALSVIPSIQPDMTSGMRSNTIPYPKMADSASRNMTAPTSTRLPSNASRNPAHVRRR